MDALHTQVQTARTIVQEGGGNFVLFVKGKQSGLLDQAKHFLPEDFPPQLLEVEQGHGRIEWRGIKVMAVTPAEMGFPHALQLPRLDRIRVLKGGKQEAETVWLITSLSADQANASRLLELARQYWSIENGLHYRLDVSSAEDRCRVRHPVAATVLGIMRRAIQGEYGGCHPMHSYKHSLAVMKTPRIGICDVRRFCPWRSTGECSKSGEKSWTKKLGRKSLQQAKTLS
jgi:predicted transposase YbfD/YdcC